jgi:hypothetical protein
MLLSRLMVLVYERLPASRDDVRAAGGASTWCALHGVHTARGRSGTAGRETAWLGRADTLEVDALLWLPWLLLATRADCSEPIPLPNFAVRLHPFFGQILSGGGGDALRAHFSAEAQRRRRARAAPSE